MINSYLSLTLAMMLLEKVVKAMIVTELIGIRMAANTGERIP